MIASPFTPVRHPVFGILRRPLIQVRLIGPERTVWQRMLLDSGADFSTLPARLAGHLGYTVGDEPSGQVRGIARVPVPYVAGELDIEIAGERFHIRLRWVQSDRAPPLLGRLGLFRQADVLFQERANAITLRPPSSQRS